MKFILPVLAALVATINAAGQTTTLSGSIISNGSPVPFATVQLGRQKQVSDSTGSFQFDSVARGRNQLRISAIGFDLFDSTIHVTNTPLQLKIQLHKDQQTIEEVVISGTMKPVSKMNSPIPVEVYSPAFFKKNPSPAIFESLQMINGVQPQLNCNVCNTGDIHINGMEGPYTMILIDGMPIVSSLSTVYGLSGIPNSMVKRIEVVKGPASTLYGSEAVGGLINIITKDAGTAEKLKLDFSGTGVGEFNTDLAAAHSFTKNLSTLVGINYFNYQQRRDINSDNFTDITLQERLSVFNKWNWQIGPNRSASLALRYITENRWGGELQWQEAFRGSNQIYGEHILTNRAELISTIALGNSSNLDISYNYHLQDSYYGTVKYYANQQVGFAQWRWNRQMGKHQLLAGLPLRYTFYDDNTPGTAGISSNKPDHSFLPGIFVQDEWAINNRLTLLAGLRYDYNSRHGSIVTPRLSVKFAPNSTNTFRLSGGNGYRVVNLFTEDHAALTGAREVIIAAALRPEQSWNGNLNYTGIIRHSNGFINLDASVFYTYFTNKITGDYFTDATKIIYDNLGGYAVSKGISLNVDCNFTNGLKINAGATFMDVYQEEKVLDKTIRTPQLFAPVLSGTFAISYTFPRQKIAIDVTGRVNGAMYLPVVPNDFRPDKSPAYSIVNLQVSKPFRNGIELYGGVKNIFNFLPSNPLLHPDDPFNRPGGKYFDVNGNPNPVTNPHGYTFDPSYNYAPVQGAKIFAGIRYQLK